MKLVIAIVQDGDTHRLLNALVEAGYRATKLGSTGGFLRQGNTTLLIGVPPEQVADVLSVIEKNCKARQQLVTSLGAPIGPTEIMPYPVEVTVGGATCFVLNVDQFAKS